MRLLLVLAVSLGFLGSGCAKKSGGGYAWGATYSPAWFMSTSDADRRAHFGSLSLVKLCSNWNKKTYSGDPYKRQEDLNEEVGKELERRGKHPFYCKDPNYK